MTVNASISMAYLKAIVEGNGKSTDIQAPHSAESVRPWKVPKNFVLCRGNDGVPTAVWEWNKWDFAPYAFMSSETTMFNFDHISAGGSDKKRTSDLIHEAKWIMFCLLYYVRSGKWGGLSISSIPPYFHIVLNISRYCLKCDDSLMMSGVTISEILSNPVYLGAFQKSIDREYQRSRLHSLARHLFIIGEEKVGFSVAVDVVNHPKLKHKQHPLIPTRIYLEFIDYISDRFESYYEAVDRIELFSESFKCPTNGAMQSTLNKRKKSGLTAVASSELLDRFSLWDVFNIKRDKSITKKIATSYLRKIQVEAKLLIHLYTGMRDKEVMRLQFSCISERKIRDSLKGRGENVIVPKKIVSVISTTTKFTGYEQEESWYAHETVLKAVRVLQAICKGVAAILDVDENQLPLFQSTRCLVNRNDKSARKIKAIGQSYDIRQLMSDKDQFRITKGDFEVLQASDDERDFSQEINFSVGSIWPFATHQFRRSLAVYASSSGFVSIPTLRKQFKHLTQEMTKYYSRRFENIKTVFGHYDTEKGKYVLPSSHFAFEMQVGMNWDTAEKLLSDMLDSESTLFGGSGGFYEKQKGRLKSGEVNVQEFREATVKQAEKGELAYRKTLLGGCTDIEACDCIILGEFSDCLTKSCSVVKSSNVIELIEATEKELEMLEPDSGEYLATLSELEDLKRFRDQKFFRSA